MSKNILFKTSLGVTLLVILQKFLGFCREALIAAYYGANAETDVFFLAQSMPGMVFPAVCNSLSIAFTSIYVTRVVKNGKESADNYASNVLIVSIGIGGVLGLLGILIAPILVPLIAPGFSKEQLSLAIYLTRIVMGTFVLIMLHYMYTAILNSNKFFFKSQIAGIISNFSIIIIILFLGYKKNIVILTIITIIGLLIQVIAQIIFSSRNFKISFFKNFKYSEIHSLLILTFPILLGNSIVQLNTVVDKILASKLEKGAISALSYSGSLNAMVIGVFVISLSTVLFPSLTQDAAKNEKFQFGEKVSQSLSYLTFILIPIACITAISSFSIVQIAFGRGAFDANAVNLSGVALLFYSPYYVSTAIREVLTRSFYALHDTKTPMANSLIGVSCNIIFSIILVRYFGIAGIALGTTLSSMIIAIVLLVITKKRIPSIVLLSFYQNFKKNFISGMILSATLLLFWHYFPNNTPMIHFSVNVILGSCVYCLVQLILKNEIIVDFIGRIKLL